MPRFCDFYMHITYGHMLLDVAVRLNAHKCPNIVRYSFMYVPYTVFYCNFNLTFFGEIMMGQKN